MRKKKKRKPIKIEERMFACIESSFAAEKNHILTSRTLNGLLDLKFWNTNNKDNFPSVGDFVELRMKDLNAAADELSSWGTLSLDSTYDKPYYCELVILNEEDVPDEVKKKIKKDRGLQRSKSKEILLNSSFWKNKDVHNFLLSFVKKYSDKFATVPAAVEHHHAYKGGLFIHSCEVFCNCFGIASSPMNEFYDRIDTDSLYLAAWLHDAGKMEIYSMDGDVPVIDSNRENMFGHIVLGDRIFRREAEEAGLESILIDAVSHCILSHHQTKEWGSAVVPLTIEAEILCRADYISSRMPD